MKNFLARLTRIKAEKIQITKISNEKYNTIYLIENILQRLKKILQNIISQHTRNLNKMEHFLEKHKLLKLTKEEIENMKNKPEVMRMN